MGDAADILRNVLDKLESNPEYKIVADVGTSMISGFGELTGYQVNNSLGIIELIFD